MGLKTWRSSNALEPLSRCAHNSPSMPLPGPRPWRSALQAIGVFGQRTVPTTYLPLTL